MTQTQDAAAHAATFTLGRPEQSTPASSAGAAASTCCGRWSPASCPPPPVMATCSTSSRLEAERGPGRRRAAPQEFHYNPLGSVHGGVISTLLDTAAGCAVHSTLPAGVGYTSLDLHHKFLRPVTVASGRLRCEGTVIQRGRRTALAEARLNDERRPAGRARHVHLHDLPDAGRLRFRAHLCMRARALGFRGGGLSGLPLPASRLPLPASGLPLPASGLPDFALPGFRLAACRFPLFPLPASGLPAFGLRAFPASGLPASGFRFGLPASGLPGFGVDFFKGYPSFSSLCAQDSNDRGRTAA